MTRQQRRSKSQYLNACRKLGWRPSRGFVYRGGRWWQRWVFVIPSVRGFSDLVARAAGDDLFFVVSQRGRVVIEDDGETD